jgi:hypothetical protein
MIPSVGVEERRIKMSQKLDTSQTSPFASVLTDSIARHAPIDVTRKNATERNSLHPLVLKLTFHHVNAGPEAVPPSFNVPGMLVFSPGVQLDPFPSKVLIGLKETCDPTLAVNGKLFRRSVNAAPTSINGPHAGVFILVWNQHGSMPTSATVDHVENGCDDG